MKPMKRISVVGSSGSGKTAVARRLAEALAVPHVELDALYWGANWSAATTDEFSERVKAATAGELSDLLGLTHLQQQLVTGWAMQAKGRALWMIGDRGFKVQTLLTPLGERLTYPSKQSQALFSGSSEY